MKTIAFTSSAVNYLPKVRKLIKSIKQYHPEFKIVWALSDEMSADIDPGKEEIDEVLAVSDLAIEDHLRWTFFHDIVELSTAIKPFVLKALLARPDVDRVIYFDPDMVLFSRLDDMLEQLDQGNVALTPHQTKPETSIEAVRDNEISSLKHGIYNLGFVGVRNTVEGNRFASWWAERIYHFCIADIPNGLFTDQRWVDFAPAYFDGVQILKNSRFNVATWNLTTRNFEGNLIDGFQVDAQPLGFYHFTGFDSGAHAVMANKNAAGNEAVRQLVQWYADETCFDKDDPASKIKWRFGTYSDGTAIPSWQRQLYRARVDLQVAFPDPFATSEKSRGLLGWMRTQAPLEYPDIEKKNL
jgi:hypothetical protein